jgi:hypothetical protein
VPPTPTRKPRIFISHSAKGAEAQEVRDKLKAALQAKYEILLDVETLKPGDPWRNRINLWLGACDAAIVLLSETALASHYVTYETSVLAYRNAAFGSLLILPVLLEDVTPAMLEASYLSPAQLDEKQLVRGTPDEIVAKVLTRLGEVGLCETTPAEKRARKLAHQLRDVPEDVLRDAADTLQLSLPLAADNPQLLLALKLLGVGMPLATQALLAVRGYIPASERAERTSTMIELIASSWVDLRCVGRIPGIAKGKEPVRAFGLNATQWDAARMYVVGASQEDPAGTWYDAPCTGVFGEDAEELIEEVRRVLIEKLTTTRDELPRDLKAFNDTGQAVIVGLDGNGMNEKILTRLRDELPHVTFFLMTGAAGAAPPLSKDFVELLFPPLLEGDEAYFLEQYQIFEPAVRFRPKR